jgi:hypothetical protein
MLQDRRLLILRKNYVIKLRVLLVEKGVGHRFERNSLNRLIINLIIMSLILHRAHFLELFLAVVSVI